DIRASAAIAAGRVFRADDKKSVHALITAVAAEGDLFPRRRMIISLGRIGGPEARKQLVAEFESQDRQNRSFAALALGIAGASDFAPRIRQEFAAASDESLKGALAISLGLMKDPDAFKVVAEVTQRHTSPEILSHLM